MRKRITKRRKSKQNKKRMRNTNKKRISGGELKFNQDLYDKSIADLYSNVSMTPEEKNIEEGRRVAVLNAVFGSYRVGIESLKRMDTKIDRKDDDVSEAIKERTGARLYDRLSLFDDYFLRLIRDKTKTSTFIIGKIRQYFNINSDLPTDYEETSTHNYVETGGVQSIPGAVPRPRYYANNPVSPSATPLLDPLSGNS